MKLEKLVVAIPNKGLADTKSNTITTKNQLIDTQRKTLVH